MQAHRRHPLVSAELKLPLSERKLFQSNGLRRALGKLFRPEPVGKLVPIIRPSRHYNRRNSAPVDDKPAGFLRDSRIAQGGYCPG